MATAVVGKGTVQRTTSACNRVGRDAAYFDKYVRGHARIRFGYFNDPQWPAGTAQFTAISAATQSQPAGWGEQYKPCAGEAACLSGIGGRAILDVMDAHPAASARKPSRLRLILILMLAAAVSAALCLHMPGLNGPAYWQWPWRRLDARRLFPLMALAVAPLAIGWATWRDSCRRTTVALIAIMLSMLAAEIFAAGVQTKPFGLKPVIYAVQSPMNTSYFFDANIPVNGYGLRNFLTDYPQLMPIFAMHSQEKPPGPILFFAAMLKVLGLSDRSALWAGLLVGV